MRLIVETRNLVVRLGPELTRDLDAKARFMLEARAASALDHPNLCTILELGETADGRLAGTMGRDAA